MAPCSSRETCAVTMGPRLYSAWVTTFPFISILSTYPKFTRIYPFFFPLSTFPKFTRNFGGYRSWEAPNGGEDAQEAPSQPSISKNHATTQFFDVPPSDVLVLSTEMESANQEPSPNLRRDESTQIAVLIVDYFSIIVSISASSSSVT